MKEKKTLLYAAPVIGSGRFVMEFGEGYWKIIENTYEPGAIGGYLHVGPGSAEEITDEVRDTIIKYDYWYDEHIFDDAQNYRPIGATPQLKYMGNLSLRDKERIGNNGEKGIYA